jgi:hypothetical protein
MFRHRIISYSTVVDKASEPKSCNLVRLSKKVPGFVARARLTFGVTHSDNHRRRSVIGFFDRTGGPASGRNRRESKALSDISRRLIVNRSGAS